MAALVSLDQHLSLNILPNGHVVSFDLNSSWADSRRGRLWPAEIQEKSCCDYPHKECDNGNHIERFCAYLVYVVIPLGDLAHQVIDIDDAGHGGTKQDQKRKNEEPEVRRWLRA